MFTVSGEDALFFSLWAIAFMGSSCAVTALIFQSGCKKMTEHLVMVVGYVIALLLNFSLPFVLSTNIRGLIAASSLLSVSLTEVRSFILFFENANH